MIRRVANDVFSFFHLVLSFTFSPKMAKNVVCGELKNENAFTKSSFAFLVRQQFVSSPF
jgi:hypothetical protein